MADKPILFSGPMVRALLAGTKTQTRRIVREQPTQRDDGLWDHHGYEAGIIAADAAHLGQWMADFQRIQVGDRLYVREAWSGLYVFRDTPPAQRESIMTPFGPHLREDVWFWADGNPEGGDYERPRPAMHMPRWASRLTLTVTDVRVERLMDISAEDAIAEGVVDTGRRDGAPYSHFTVPGVPGIVIEHEPEPVYAQLWEMINGEGSWKANPWVAAYTFTVEHGNIDKLERAA